MHISQVVTSARPSPAPLGEPAASSSPVSASLIHQVSFARRRPPSLLPESRLAPLLLSHRSRHPCPNSPLTRIHSVVRSRRFPALHHCTLLSAASEILDPFDHGDSRLFVAQQVVSLKPSSFPDRLTTASASQCLDRKPGFLVYLVFEVLLGSFFSSQAFPCLASQCDDSQISF